MVTLRRGPVCSDTRRAGVVNWWERQVDRLLHHILVRPQVSVHEAPVVVFAYEVPASSVASVTRTRRSTSWTLPALSHLGRLSLMVNCTVAGFPTFRPTGSHCITGGSSVACQSPDRGPCAATSATVAPLVRADPPVSVGTW